MRKLSKASIGLLLIGSISMAQPQKYPSALLCYVNGKNCTLEDISKILSGTSPSETKCECIEASIIPPRTTGRTIEGKKVYRIFLEEPVLTGTLVIPYNVALLIEHAPYTTLKGEIVNEGTLETMTAGLDVRGGFPLYFEGKLENHGEAFLALLPKKATIINKGTLYLSTYSQPFFQIKSSPLFARLNRLKLYSDYIGEASIKNKGTLRIDNFLRGSIETRGDLYLGAPSEDIPAFEGTINISGGSVEISGYIRNTTINGDGYTPVTVRGSLLENVTCNGVFLRQMYSASSFVNTNCLVR